MGAGSKNLEEVGGRGMQHNKWVRLLAYYVTSLINQEMLLQNVYLAAENRPAKPRVTA